jgi:adenylylsulfate kinase
MNIVSGYFGDKIMAFVLWMTGLPCSGKTTISKELRKIIPKMEVLDGDELYEWLAPYDFSKDARISQTLRVAHIVKMLIKHNVSVCVSMISSFEQSRRKAYEIINDDRFALCYVKCSLEICEKRDEKGMYKKARSGVIKNFTGISDPYDIPEHPDLVLDTEKFSKGECVKIIKDYLIKNKFILSTDN